MRLKIFLHKTVTFSKRVRRSRKNRLIMKNYIKILLVFAPMFFGSIITESLPRQWFGDWKCEGAKLSETKRHYPDGEIFYSDHFEGCDYAIGINGSHAPTWHWGFRRYIIIALGVVMTVYSVVKAVDN